MFIGSIRTGNGMVKRGDLTRDDLVGLLRESPQRISAMVEGIEPTQFQVRRSNGEWSLIEILAHLRTIADSWHNVIQRSIAEADPIIGNVPMSAGLIDPRYTDIAWPDSLSSFASQRTELLTLLESLVPADWERTSTARFYGRTSVGTLGQYLYRYAVHEQSHWSQIRATARELLASQLST